MYMCIYIYIHCCPRLAPSPKLPTASLWSGGVSKAHSTGPEKGFCALLTSWIATSFVASRVRPNCNQTRLKATRGQPKGTRETTHIPRMGVEGIPPQTICSTHKSRGGLSICIQNPALGPGNPSAGAPFAHAGPKPAGPLSRRNRLKLCQVAHSSAEALGLQPDRENQHMGVNC